MLLSEKTPSDMEPILRVEFDPADSIAFCGDFQTAIKSELTVKNRSSFPLLFKMKTTSPNRYIVSPHKGRIEAKRYMVITITLLPFLFKPEQKHVDKFLIQICKDSKINQEYSKHDFWTMITRREMIQKKFRCLYRHEIDSPASLANSDQSWLASTTPTPSILISSEDGTIANPLDSVLALTSEPDQKAGGRGEQTESSLPSPTKASTVAPPRVLPEILGHSRPRMEHSDARMSPYLIIFSSISLLLTGFILGKYLL